MKLLTLVTGSNSKYFKHTIQLIDNISNIIKQNENINIVFYDLGLNTEELMYITTTYIDIIINNFDFSIYPEHVSLKLYNGFNCTYAWKPIIIHEVCEKYNNLVYWMDTRTLYTSFDNIIDILTKHCIYTPISDGNIQKWTYPSVIKLMNGEKYVNNNNRAAGVFGINYNIKWCKELMLEWKTLALKKEYISPTGSNRSNHRQDQSILSILYYKYIDLYKFKNISTAIDLKVHNSLELKYQNLDLNYLKNKVSIIIPSYNRHAYLLNTINSIKQQTYKNIEIIVINDCSTQDNYYNYNWEENNIKILHLKKNSKDIFGYVCAGYVRNQGINIATGKYIAFCDDDDIWFNNKLLLQIKAMYDTGCKMSSTDGLIGTGMYDCTKKYKLYNKEHYYNILQKIYSSKNSSLLLNGFPDIWTYKFLNIHNCMICSSVIIEKDILDQINNFKEIKPPGEDYNCWLRALKHTDSVYIDKSCFYYDASHGDGQHY